MSIDSAVTRRALLAAGAAGAGTIALAACSSSGGSSADTSTRAAPPNGAAPGTTLATLADIPLGQAISVRLPGDKPGVVARPTATTAAAFSAICTHMGCTVRPAGRKLDCPCHGSVFDATTGKVLHGPAPSPLPAVQVTVTGGKVVTT